MAISKLRATRIRRARALKAKGLNSKEIGRRMNLSPSTVRDYLTDPYRARARKRQRKWAVDGVSQPAGGTPVSSVKGKNKRWHPHEGVGVAHNRIRGRQFRAVLGYYAKGA